MGGEEYLILVGCSSLLGFMTYMIRVDRILAGPVILLYPVISLVKKSTKRKEKKIK